MKRHFAVRRKDNKELYATMSVTASKKNIRVEQARLWDRLDEVSNPYQFEFLVMEKVDDWMMPAGSWMAFDLTPTDYYKLIGA